MQYYGWALRNRAALMPSREQVAARRGIGRGAARAAITGRIVIDAVVPDYCCPLSQGLRGRLGAALAQCDAGEARCCPCHAAETIPGLAILERARSFARRHLGEFSGLQCISRHRLDEGAVRAAARAASRISAAAAARPFALTGDSAAAADPVCHLSPQHGRVDGPRLRSATTSAYSLSALAHLRERQDAGAPDDVHQLRISAHRRGQKGVLHALAQDHARRQLVRELEVPRLGGRAFIVEKNHILRVTAIEGPQVADFNAFNKDDPKEMFWSGRTRLLQRAHLSVGDRLWSTPPRMRPMFTIIADTVDHKPLRRNARSHDLMYCRCNERLYEVVRNERRRSELQYQHGERHRRVRADARLRARRVQHLHDHRARR